MTTFKLKSLTDKLQFPSRNLRYSRRCPQFEKMRKLKTAVLFIFLTICSYGQNQDKTPDYLKMTETDSLYLIAIQKYTDELDSFYQSNPERKNPRIIYIQHEDYLRLIPGEINGYKIHQLGVSNRKKYFKENNNTLELVEISPLAIQDGRFKISLIPYLAELKSRNRLDLSLSDWTNIYFLYEDGKLIYEETGNGGI